MNTIKYHLNKSKLIQMVLIMGLFFTRSIGYCSAYPWTTQPYLIGSFAPIPIAVTLLSVAQTINHTWIEIYSDTACNLTTGTIINIGSDLTSTFIFNISTTYFLGLSAFTNDFYNNTAQSIKVQVDADSSDSGSVCIPITCTSIANCTAGSGPFSLSI